MMIVSSVCRIDWFCDVVQELAVWKCCNSYERMCWRQRRPLSRGK